MKLTHYFLKHPIIALVLNAMILVIGILCFKTLTLREYPEIHFPQATVHTSFPNASAFLVESAITSVLEEQLSGISGIESMTSQSKQGLCEIKLTFQPGVSMDRTMMAIREAVGLARGRLPHEASEPIIEQKTSSTGMPFIALSLESTTLDFAALTHFANLNLKSPFRGIQGVASADVWGQPYTYEITLNAKKMMAFGVNADEVFNTLAAHHLALPVGKFQHEIPTTLKMTLSHPSDYEQIIIKEQNASKHQPPVLLKHIAVIRLKADNEQFRVRVNGKPGLAIAINRSPDGNPLEISASIRALVKRLQSTLPHGVKLTIISDQADFVRASLHHIKTAIIEAIVFVLLIVFLFLRNAKATLIPLITIPISLMGSFIFLKGFGGSINIMTLMAMVLAAGLVVDDAIVMLENSQRHLDEGASPMESAYQSSKEMGFSIVAMTLTLACVYAPLAFISGPIGQLFTEFSIALAGSVLISGVVALTLSPLMCARCLSKNTLPLWPQFDDYFEKISKKYRQLITHALPYKKTCLAITASLFIMIFILIHLIPQEMAPKEDRSLIGVFIPPIPGKTIDTLEEKLKSIEKIMRTLPEAHDTLVFMGDWGGSMILPLKPQHERSISAHDLVEFIRPKLNPIPSVDVYPWSWDSGLPGMDEGVGHNELSLTLSTTHSYRHLFNQVEAIRKVLDKEASFQNVRHDLTLDTQSMQVHLLPREMSALNLTAQQVAKTIEIFFSGDQSLSFSKDGLLYPVSLKGTPSPWSLSELYVTNPSGKRISLAAVATLTETTQPETLIHDSQMRAVTLTATLKKGDTLNEAMPRLLATVNKHLPIDYKKSWAGSAKTYAKSQLSLSMLFLLALLFIFAILSVQFENFVDPFIILLTVPLACSGALFFIWALGQSLNIYTQVGLITLIGLISKHGILIVSFANLRRNNNISIKDAIIESASLRLRPILMTTGAMIFGAIPLVLSHDAGYESRHAMGTVLIAGLSVGTLFTLFVLPCVYWMVKKPKGTQHDNKNNE
jgi:multidrug efflux pump